MSGLIWAGLGKGIAEAGTTFGNALFKAIDNDLSEQRLLDREERRAKLKEEADERKSEREAQERMDIAAAASSRADEMAISRDAGIVGRIASNVAGEAPAMSQAEIEKLIAENPQYSDIYRQSGIIQDKVDPRLQRASDEEQAVRESGAKASFVEAYAKAKQDVLKQIAQENKDRATEKRLDNESRRIDALIERMGVQNKVSQQNADANMIRANRPPSSGGADPNKPATTADIQRQINAAKDDIALTLGVSKNDVNGMVATIKKRAAAGDAQAKSKLESIQPFLGELQDANERMRQFKRPANEGGASTAKGSDNSNVKSGPGKIPEPKTQADFRSLPAGTRYKAPDGTIRIKS